MTGFRVMRLVDEIRKRRLSRNKNYALMSRGDYRSAMRLKRYLDALGEEIKALGEAGDLTLRLERIDAERVALHLRLSRLGLRRTSYLSVQELHYLECHHPQVVHLIAGSGHRPPASCAQGIQQTVDHGEHRDVEQGS